MVGCVPRTALFLMAFAGRVRATSGGRLQVRRVPRGEQYRVRKLDTVLRRPLRSCHCVGHSLMSQAGRLWGPLEQDVKP